LSATIGFIVNRPLNFIDPSGNLQYFLLEIFPVFFGPQMYLHDLISFAAVDCVLLSHYH
jgi:hypothetical protein